MTTTDWLYLRAYGGPARHSLEVDPVVRVTADWVARRAPERWHFLRYVDVDGQHVRVRLRGDLDSVDRWYADLPELEESLARVRTRARERLLEDPMVGTVGSRRGISLGVYAPETHKYGTDGDLADAEAHFDHASTWCVQHRVWRWSAATRVAVGVHYLSLLAAALDAAGEGLGTDLLDRHRAHWSPRLRLAGVDTDRARAAQRAVRAADLEAQQSLVGLAGGLVDHHVHTGLSAGADVARSFNLAHMDLNRIGLNPVEECLAGLIARGLRGDQQRHRAAPPSDAHLGKEI